MASFLSRRYTLVFIDRATGIAHRVSLRVGWALATVALLFAVPVLVGLGIRWSALAEIAALRGTATSLELENASYREATGELTTQITSLQSVIEELGERAQLDPETLRSMQQLPAVVRTKAMGGGAPAQPPSFLAAALASPEDTFSLLREVLGRLEGRLRIVRTDVERREALAAATPSIWPTVGWISSGVGSRPDPFTGDPSTHHGMDISADSGRPVYATASGTVESAGWSGNYGNLVVIDHGYGLQSRYGHLSKFSVRPGQQVNRGDQIGNVGMTGRATGPHLHYEVLADGKNINPLRLLGPRD